MGADYMVMLNFIAGKAVSVILAKAVRTKYQPSERKCMTNEKSTFIV